MGCQCREAAGRCGPLAFRAGVPEMSSVTVPVLSCVFSHLVSPLSSHRVNMPTCPPPRPLKPSVLPCFLLRCLPRGFPFTLLKDEPIPRLSLLLLCPLHSENPLSTSALGMPLGLGSSSPPSAFPEITWLC